MNAIDGDENNHYRVGQLKNEFLVMNKLKHPYILQVYNFHNSITVEGQKCHIVMEYTKHGDLLKFSNKLKCMGQVYKESTLRRWLK